MHSKPPNPWNLTWLLISQRASKWVLCGNDGLSGRRLHRINMNPISLTEDWTNVRCNSLNESTQLKLSSGGWATFEWEPYYTWTKTVVPRTSMSTIYRIMTFHFLSDSLSALLHKNILILENGSWLKLDHINIDFSTATNVHYILLHPHLSGSPSRSFAIG